MPLGLAAAKSYTSLDDHIMVKEMEKRYGINLKFSHVPAGEMVEKLKLMIASSTYPDVIKYSFDFYPGGANQAVKDGVLININNYLDKYAPNLKR